MVNFQHCHAELCGENYFIFCLHCLGRVSKYRDLYKRLVVERRLLHHPIVPDDRVHYDNEV